jgi:hypothetical protein
VKKKEIKISIFSTSFKRPKKVKKSKKSIKQVQKILNKVFFVVFKGLLSR